MNRSNIVMITGANSGIGRAAALQLAEKGFQVILVCRNKERGGQTVDDIKNKTGNDQVHLLLGDLSSQVSIRNLADAFTDRFKNLDVLINNAANFDLTLKKPVQNADSQELIWATNFLGPFLLINQMLGKMNEGGRIINISSKGLLAHPFLKLNFEDPGFFSSRKFSPAKAYYHSKLALEIITYVLAEKTKSTGVRVNGLRVTSVKVDSSRFSDQSAILKKIYQLKTKSAWEPEKMAQMYVRMADSSENDGISGFILDEYGNKIKPSRYALNRDIQEKLWETAVMSTRSE